MEPPPKTLRAQQHFVILSEAPACRSLGAGRKNLIRIQKFYNNKTIDCLLGYDSYGSLPRGAAGRLERRNKCFIRSVNLSVLAESPLESKTMEGTLRCKVVRLCPQSPPEKHGSDSAGTVNSYDGDGNLLTLKRFDSRSQTLDNFSYGYYTNTNKLKFVTGASVQYTYDNNGNVTGDSLNHLYDFKYDYRNLIVSFKRVETVVSDKGTVTYYDRTNYLYDEAGNRILKLNFRYNGGGIPDPDNDNPGYWTLQNSTYYVRDVSGKELALYDGTTLSQWNMYGLDNIGKINADTTKYYYLKDHLGTIRAVVNSTNTIVSAGDYDAWGYPLQNRSYESGVSKYKFTGKERDKESGLNNAEGYDYFGARYYNSRVANWTSVDPLFEKHYSYTPYNYVLRNPLYYFDPDGKQVQFMEKAIEFMTKSLVRFIIREGTKPKENVGFGEKGEDYDHDGVPNELDEIDNRTEEQKINDELEKIELNQKLDKSAEELEQEKHNVWDVENTGNKNKEKENIKDHKDGEKKDDSKETQNNWNGRLAPNQIDKE